MLLTFVVFYWWSCRKNRSILKLIQITKEWYKWIIVALDHVYYWHPRSSVDRYWRSTPWSTRDRHSIDISVDPRLTHGRHLGRQTFNFRWHSIEWQSILAMTTHWMLVDVSIATLRSALGRMSVVWQWCIGSMSVMYSSQYPSSPGGGALPCMGHIGMCGP